MYSVQSVSLPQDHLQDVPLAHEGEEDPDALEHVYDIRGGGPLSSDVEWNHFKVPDYSHSEEESGSVSLSSDKKDNLLELDLR